MKWKKEFQKPKPAILDMDMEVMDQVMEQAMEVMGQAMEVIDQAIQDPDLGTQETIIYPIMVRELLELNIKSWNMKW